MKLSRQRWVTVTVARGGCAHSVLHTQSLDSDTLGLKPADLKPLSLEPRVVPHAQLPSAKIQQMHALDDGGGVHLSACDA
eukprot:6658429-Lingulodinium_polyedra.AAC.1